MLFDNKKELDVEIYEWFGFYLGGCLWFFCRKSIILIYRVLVNGCYCIKLLIFFMCILK